MQADTARLFQEKVTRLQPAQYFPESRESSTRFQNLTVSHFESHFISYYISRNILESKTGRAGRMVRFQKYALREGTQSIRQTDRKNQFYMEDGIDRMLISDCAGRDEDSWR